MGKETNRLEITRGPIDSNMFELYFLFIEVVLRVTRMFPCASMLHRNESRWPD